MLFLSFTLFLLLSLSLSRTQFHSLTFSLFLCCSLSLPHPPARSPLSLSQPHSLSLSLNLSRSRSLSLALSLSLSSIQRGGRVGSVPGAHEITGRTASTRKNTPPQESGRSESTPNTKHTTRRELETSHSGVYKRKKKEKKERFPPRTQNDSHVAPLYPPAPDIHCTDVR